MDQDSSIVPAELFDSCFLYCGKHLLCRSFPPNYKNRYSHTGREEEIIYNTISRNRTERYVLLVAIRGGARDLF